jgi:BASS family bile acid:Na+ symporter
MPTYFGNAGLAALFFNLVVLGTAFLVSGRLASGPRQRMAITIECGFQNAGLGIVIANTMLGSSTIGVVSAVYGLIMLVTGGLMVYFKSNPEDQQLA